MSSLAFINPRLSAKKVQKQTLNLHNHNLCLWTFSYFCFHMTWRICIFSLIHQPTIFDILSVIYHMTKGIMAWGVLSHDKTKAIIIFHLYHMSWGIWYIICDIYIFTRGVSSLIFHMTRGILFWYISWLAVYYPYNNMI